MTEDRKDYSQAEREKMAKAGTALPDGSYPIANTTDLKNAIQAVGRASNPAAAKAHIKKRAAALGATDLLPEDWRALEVGDDVEDRADSEPDGDECETCDGLGTVNGETCPDCEGNGKASAMTGADTASSEGGQQQNEADEDLEKRRERLAILEGTIERRDFPASEMEIRETSDGGLRFTGYASTTETPYEVMDFTETIAKGAFRRTLGEDPDVVLLRNHDGFPLARTKSGTMTLSEDSRGLRVDADLDSNDPDVQALIPKMQRGDLTEMSFAFRATEQEWDEDYTTRTIKAVNIHRGDVSMVTHGANSATTGTVSIRSADAEEEKPAPPIIRSYLTIAKAKRARAGRTR